ncbi:MAG: hypothetical protein FD127_4312, partial [Acidimicrobiaceae bacterium]
TNVTLNFTLTQVATGTISGIVWVNPNPVISQVVAATQTWALPWGPRTVEYVELFNPTTYAINMGQTGSPIGIFEYDCEAAGFDKDVDDLNFVYITTFVPAGKYFLIANATAFYINGSLVHADACYGSGANCDTAPTFPDFIDDIRAGSVQIGNIATNTLWDKVGWNDDNNDACLDPGECEGTAIPNYIDGMGIGNQIVRVSSPLASSAEIGTYGRAYDSDDNRSDFLYPTVGGFTGILFNPGQTTDPAMPVITGRPGVGAVIASNDALSGSTVAYRATVSSAGIELAYAPFAIPRVTSGTWTVIVASGSYYKQLSNVVVTVNSNINIPNAVTTPDWEYLGGAHVNLDSATVSGFVTGRVSDITDSSLSGITVRA